MQVAQESAFALVRLLFVLCTLSSFCLCRLLSDELSQLPASEKLSESDALSGDGCPFHSNPSLHLIMERVCEICHDMVSHSQPNMRAQCRSNCFRSPQFRSCVRLFTPQRATRHTLVY